MWGRPSGRARQHQLPQPNAQAILSQVPRFLDIATPNGQRACLRLGPNSPILGCSACYS